MSTKNYLSDGEGGSSRGNKDLNCTRSNEDRQTDLASIEARKASRRGKMAHVTQIVNNIYKLIEIQSNIRDVERAIQSLNEPLKGFLIRHEKYIVLLTDNIDID